MSASSYSKNPWELPGWANPFVQGLFSQRGFNPLSEEISGLIEGQWSNWKRLLIDSGLAHDRETAEQIAYKFASHKVIGGAGRIFENFAEFLNSKPKAVREFEESRYLAPVDSGCEICEGEGVVMAPVVNREGRQKNAAFGCSCQLGRTRYGGIPAATPEILEWKQGKNRAEREKDREYQKGLGLDPDKPVGFSEFNRKVQDVARNPPQIAQERLSGGQSIDSTCEAQSSIWRNSWGSDGHPVPVEAREDSLALAIFENGEERGWNE